MKHVLLVDDEKRIREVVEYALAKSGYRVTALAEGEPVLELLAEDPPDLIVLDVTLPGIDGLELCRRIRARGTTPILFLSARSDEVDRIVGLELGADDYLVKPFSPRELVARVRAVLRRFEAAEERSAHKTASRVLRHGKLEIDPERFDVRFDGQRIGLTATEFAVLSALYERPGVVLSRGQLLERAYATDIHVTERTLDTHVRRIRAKFRGSGGDPIATVHGVGYKAGVGVSD
jgi:two-component system OmpR family response regulator